jgi:hypothetical protein
LSRTASVSARLLLPTLAVAALWGLLRCVPFDLPSYAAWTGILLALLSLTAMVKPSCWLWLPRRAQAAVALCAAVAITSVATVWPLSVIRAPGPRGPLDDYLPEYQAAELHEARTRAPMARVAEAIRHVSLADMAVADLLIRLRGLGGGSLRSPQPERTPLLELMLRSGSGFLALDDTDPKTVIYGMVGRPWADGQPPDVRSAADFRAFQVPGNVRVAFDLRAVEEGGGVVRISTETRILGTDAAAQRNFARYWRLVYPGSAIIRRVWLDAIVARAERAAP